MRPRPRECPRADRQPPSRRKIDWHHESMSVQMLQLMVDENQLDLAPDNIRTITDYITGARPQYGPL